MVQECHWGCKKQVITGNDKLEPLPTNHLQLWEFSCSIVSTTLTWPRPFTDPSLPPTRYVFHISNSWVPVWISTKVCLEKWATTVLWHLDYSALATTLQCCSNSLQQLCEALIMLAHRFVGRTTDKWIGDNPWMLWNGVSKELFAEFHFRSHWHLIGQECRGCFNKPPITTV